MESSFFIVKQTVPSVHATKPLREKKAETPGWSGTKSRLPELSPRGEEPEHHIASDEAESLRN